MEVSGLCRRNVERLNRVWLQCCSMAQKIKAGEEYELETRGGSTVRVRAESEVWENSKGIEGFDATLLEAFGGLDAGDFKIIQTHIYEVVA